jgi:hypothetical protein
MHLWKLVFLFLCIGVTILSVVTKGYHLFDSDRIEPFIQGADDTHYYIWLRSMVVDGDLDFRNDFEMTPFLDEHSREMALTQPLTETGLVPNKFPVGWAVITLPFFLITHLVLQISGAQVTGFEPVFQIVVWIQQMSLAGLGFWVLRRLMLRWFESQIVWLAILSGWVISMLVYYQTARVSMVHNAVFVLGVIVCWLSFLIKDVLTSSKRCSAATLLGMAVLTGFAAGLMVICRPSAMVYLVFPLFILLGAMVRVLLSRPMLTIWTVSGGVLGVAIGILPQLLAWKVLYGHWIYYSYEGEGFNWGAPQILASLFSDNHGLFNWHPGLWIGLTGLCVASILRRFPAAWMLSVGLIVWTNSSWHMVDFGSAFGGRAYEFLVVFAIFGHGFLLDWLENRPGWRHGLLSSFVVLALWNIAFLYAFMQGYVARQDPVTWNERISGIWQVFRDGLLPF